jgi:hypothetical protein
MASAVSAVVAVAIILGSTLLVVNIIMPTIEEGRDFQSYSESKKTLELIDATITQVFFEAPGSRRSIDLNVREGKFIVSGADDRIRIGLEDMELFTPGIRRQEGAVTVTSGAQVDSYENDVDGDGNTEIVIENDDVLLAIKKLGSPTNHVIVNTSSLIVLIQNKRTRTDIFYPKSTIYINDSIQSSFGIGYTELSDRSPNIASASIHFYVNATLANITYDGVFTGGPSQDFMEFHVTHVQGNMV